MNDPQKTTRAWSILLVAMLFSPTLSAAPEGAVEPPAGRPALVVGLVVDQMRWDYLHRFSARYGEGGFKRLLREGFSCDNVQINYVPTVTAIGHASIYTGSVPAIHGIAGNDIIIQATGEGAYCVGDKTVSAVGPAKVGARSPRNLRSNTVTDELRLATNFRSKVVGVALKDRGAILPAGHSASAAYWFDDETGSWGTSTYYMTALPSWVDRFNASGVSEGYARRSWDYLYPKDSYVLSADPGNPYERKSDGEATGPLPLEVGRISRHRHAGVRLSPFGDSLTLDFARAAVAGENLGARGEADFLAVSLSSPDAVGHMVGTNSPKMEDLYLRLDREIEGFLAWLDERFGRDGYLLFLTADHGAAHNARFLADNRIPSGVWDERKNLAELDALLKARHGHAGLVLGINNYRVCLNNPLIAEKKLDERAIREDCARHLANSEGVAYAVDVDRVAEAPMPALLRERIINGYHRERSGVVQIVLKPGWYSGSALGTTHGVWNPHDAHIPLIWFGRGIAPGSTHRPAAITDIAPTLAALLDIQAPNGAIGEPITEVLAARRSP